MAPLARSWPTEAHEAHAQTPPHSNTIFTQRNNFILKSHFSARKQAWLKDMSANLPCHAAHAAGGNLDKIANEIRRSDLRAERGFVPRADIATLLKPMSRLNGYPNRTTVPGVKTNTAPLGPACRRRRAWQRRPNSRSPTAKLCDYGGRKMNAPKLHDRHDAVTRVLEAHGLWRPSPRGGWWPRAWPSKVWLGASQAATTSNGRPPNARRSLRSGARQIAARQPAPD